MRLCSISYIVFVAAFICTTGIAQSPWILQSSPSIPLSPDPKMVFSAVDENVCWGMNTTNAEVILTLDGGANWAVSTITNEALFCCGISAIDAQSVWVAMRNTSLQTGGIFKTTDAGLSWIKSESVFNGSGAAPNIIHFFDADNGICVGNARGNPLNWEIYTTSDGGSVWNKVPAGSIPEPMVGEKGIPGIEGVSSGNTFWFNTFYGSLYRTTDKGITWTVTRDVLGNQDGFGFDFIDNLNGIACTFVTGNKISYSSDGGTTWNPIPVNGLSGVSPFYVRCIKDSPGHYVITAHNNVTGITQAVAGSAYTIDNGITWNYIDDLPRGPLSFASGRIGWAGGLGDLIYKWDSDKITSVEEDNLIESFNLEQNYPNPFNPATTIVFSIAEEAKVTLSVYNILGEPVGVLKDEVLKPGTYNVSFDGSGLATGIYLYRIQAGSFTQTRKMTLMK